VAKEWGRRVQAVHVQPLIDVNADTPNGRNMISILHSAEDKIMSRERIEGAAQKAVGAAKQAIGKAIGNEELQVEGLADKVVGSAKETVGKAKDALHKATR